MRLMPVAYYCSVVSLIALIFLCLAWELWLAPLRPGGTALALKALPLMLPLFGILRGRIYTYQWSAMLILAYFAEGIVRAYSDAGAAARLAVVEIALAMIFFTGSVLFIRCARRRRAGAAVT